MLSKTRNLVKSVRLCVRTYTGQSEFRHTRGVHTQLAGQVNVDGAEVHYEKVGNGKNVLLFTPGAIGSSRTDFKAQMKYLNRDLFTIIAWDPPGLGRSKPEREWSDDWFAKDATTAANLMLNLGFDKYTALGWSDGGLTAFRLAAHAPENVHKLVVWSTHSHLTSDEMHDYRAAYDLSHWSRKTEARFVTEYGKERLQSLWYEWMNGLELYYNTKKADETYLKDVLTKIACPTLLVHGLQNPFVPQRHADFFHGNLSNSKLVIMDEAKHMLHLRYGKEFNAELEKFIIEPAKAS